MQELVITKKMVIKVLLKIQKWVEEGMPEHESFSQNGLCYLTFRQLNKKNPQFHVSYKSTTDTLSSIFKECNSDYTGSFPFNHKSGQRYDRECEYGNIFKNPRRVAFLQWVKNNYRKPKVFKKEYKNQVIKELKNLYDWVDDGCPEENDHNYKPYNGLCSYIRNKFSITGEAETFLRNLFKKYDPDCDTQYPFNYGSAEFWKSEVESDSLYNNEKRIAFLKWISENY